MNIFSSSDFRLFAFYLLLIGVACSPIWAVDYFVNQDGSGHLYGSYLMLELLKGNSSVSAIFSFNSISLPNSSGHWLMVLLLNFFSAFTTTKIIVTLTFAGFVASVGWLRLKTGGRDGLKTSLLIGAAIGFNWLWFLGFYNFIIGVICFSFTIGLFYNWRENLDLKRSIMLSGLLLIVYFSHLVSFAILAGCIFLLTISASTSRLKKNLIWIFVAFLPVLPLALIYKSLSVSGGGFSPVWRSLENPFSLMSWFSQIRTADPFIIISRKMFPFSSAKSEFLPIFTPILWIFLSFCSLTIATLFKRDKLFRSKNGFIFIFLFLGCVFAAVFAPDDFGLTNGSILRERILLCGLILFVPLFQADNSFLLKRFAQICLIFVILFQTTAVWEYSLQTNREAKEFLSARSVIAENDSIASVVLIEDGLRFHSLPMTQMTNYLGFGKNIIVWDNYEAGHYLFPIIAKNPADKQFIFDLTTSNVFSINNPSEKFDEKLSKLDSVFSNNPVKIKTLIVWGTDARVEAVIFKWFEAQPFFENGHIRLFHSK